MADPKNIVLDEAAEALFRDLGGVGEAASGRDSVPGLDEALHAQEGGLDQRRLVLCDLVYGLGRLAAAAPKADRVGAQKAAAEVLDRLASLSGFGDKDDRVLVRLRGEKGAADYEVLFGVLRMDEARAAEAEARLGARGEHMARKLAMGFKALAHTRIVNVLMTLPAGDEAAQKRLRLGLYLLFDFLRTGQGLDPLFEPALRVIPDEARKPDYNLTALAAVNGLKPETSDALIKKIRTLMLKAGPDDPVQEYVGIYDAVFGFKKLAAQLKRPLLEVNNPRWFVAERPGQAIGPARSRLARLVAYEFGKGSDKSARLLNSLFAEDYGRVDACCLEDRLCMASELMGAVERLVPKQGGLKEATLDVVRKNLDCRLDVVPDETYDGLVVKGGMIRAREGGEDKVRNLQCDPALVELVDFYQQRSLTKEKMKSLISHRLAFDEDDFAAISRDFQVPVEDARQLVSLLESSFDANGRFARRVFEKNIPAFARHEKKVFEFLWHYLKAIMNRQDRIALLNALQLLIDQMKSPMNALKTLIEDLIHDPETISFSDRNALMLANLLLRKYNKELHNDIEVTPEEVLLVVEGLNPEAVEFVREFFGDRRQDFLKKVKALHKGLKDSLDPAGRAKTMPSHYMLTLEREAYIILSLLDGEVARTVLGSAIREYGNPESEIYWLSASKNHMQGLMQVLQVVVRGLARVGDADDLAALRDLSDRENGFYGLSGESRHQDQVRRLMKFVDQAMDAIRGRGASGSEFSFEF